MNYSSTNENDPKLENSSFEESFFDVDQEQLYSDYTELRRALLKSNEELHESKRKLIESHRELIESHRELIEKHGKLLESHGGLIQICFRLIGLLPENMRQAELQRLDPFLPANYNLGGGQQQYHPQQNPMYPVDYGGQQQFQPNMAPNPPNANPGQFLQPDLNVVNPGDDAQQPQQHEHQQQQVQDQGGHMEDAANDSDGNLMGR